MHYGLDSVECVVHFNGLMAEDILHKNSPAELKMEIDKIARADQRSLPQRSKVFAAIAALQGFSKLPETAPPAEINRLVLDGHVEIQRGLSSNKGVDARIFASDLVLGPFYPGTMAVLGNGIYFATPPKVDIPGNSTEAFPAISSIAQKYAVSDTGNGILIRAVLPKAARIADKSQFDRDWYQYRNRAKDAGIVDKGALLAALGFDAFFCEGVDDGCDEVVWVVLNRSMLTIQRLCRIVPKSN